MSSTSAKPTHSGRAFARVYARGAHNTAAAVVDLAALQESEYGSDFELIDAQSNYGSDFDTDGEAAVEELLAHLDGGQALVLENLEDEFDSRSFVHVPKTQDSRDSSQDHVWNTIDYGTGKVSGQDVHSMEEDTGGVEAGCHATSPQVDRKGQVTTTEKAQPDVGLTLEGESPRPEEQNAEEQQQQQQQQQKDSRSPLERFRTAPKKPLSVTDIVSPAWCQLQYWYTLTKHGRKRRTPAMKQGSRVHRVLEEQVHQIVPVQIQTREDGWGLKIWNVIQGLRTLRATGLTRELEVWGVIDGQVVNGVIDELSYHSSAPEFERDEKSQPALPEEQTTINEFFKAINSQSSKTTRKSGSSKAKKVYITDVKTRSANVLPRGASLLPTQYQLMLYHKLLSSLSTNKVSANAIFTRYSLGSTSPFTDGFVAEVGGLDFSITPENTPDGADDAPTDAITELLKHNSLTALWSLMIQEFSLSIPAESISNVLSAEFRSQQDGALLGRKHFEMDQQKLEHYLSGEMKWWKGEREPRGVEIEDAFKCRICEFAEECTWRKAKIDESIEKHRARIRSKAESISE